MIKDGGTGEGEDGGLFLEQFAKLGLYPKVHALAEGGVDGGASSDGDSENMITSASGGGGGVEATAKEDATEICSGKGYAWRDWSIARGRDCLYIWSDACALELSNGSNGWFR